MFGNSKARVVELKVVQLLDRLFGRSNVECMNIQRGSGGLLSDLRDEFRDEFDRIREKFNKLEDRIDDLEERKPKSRKKRR